MLSVNEINLLQAQNEGLKKQNAELQKENVEQQKALLILATGLEIRQRKLQEIKEIAESAMAKQQEYKKDFEQILDLITKAESEEK